MILLELPEVKACMSKLLLSDTFDNFLFIEGEITTFNTFSIDGFIHRAFYDLDDTDLVSFPDAYSQWKELREYCFSLIKGKRTPLNFKLVFSLSRANIANLITSEGLAFSPDDVQGLYLNFRYDGSVLQCVTGTSLRSFSMDKSLEHSWDEMVKRFFKKKEIVYQ